MSIVEWNATYSVGVEKLDKEHQILFSLVNDFLNALRVGKGSAAVHQTLRDLSDYTVYHFSSEESLMVRSGFPHLAAHRAEHQRLIKDLENIKHELEQEKSGPVMINPSFLRDWLGTHILTTDSLYADYLKTKGIKWQDRREAGSLAPAIS